MKTIYFLTTLFFFNHIHFYAQAEANTVLTGLSGSFGVAVHGNNLYTTDNNHHKILKADLTANPIAAADFVTTGLSSPEGLLIHGNDLYITEFNGQGSRILKVDLTAATPVAIEVVGGLTSLELIAVHENDLYVSESDSNKIVKIDLTAEIPVATDVATGLREPVGLAIHGNDLYVAASGLVNEEDDEEEEEGIFKIDLTAEAPLVANEFVTVTAPRGLAIHGNELYIAEGGEIFELDDMNNFVSVDSKISKVDLSATGTPVVNDVLTTGFNDPWQLVVVEGILYIADLGIGLDLGKVLKLDLNASLSVADTPPALSNVQIVPNPATNFIQVSRLKTTEKYAIYNILGAEIKSGTVSNTEEIDIRNLSKGLYFLKLGKEDILELVKK
jgi:hypothetical protein